MQRAESLHSIGSLAGKAMSVAESSLDESFETYVSSLKHENTVFMQGMQESIFTKRKLLEELMIYKEEKESSDDE